MFDTARRKVDCTETTEPAIFGRFFESSPPGEEIGDEAPNPCDSKVPAVASANVTNPDPADPASGEGSAPIEASPGDGIEGAAAGGEDA